MIISFNNLCTEFIFSSGHSVNYMIIIYKILPYNFQIPLVFNVSFLFIVMYLVISPIFHQKSGLS